MRLRKISEILLATYGVITALDKLDNLVKEEQNYKFNKELKRRIRKGYIANDYEWLMFDSKDSALRFLDRLRDDIDLFHSISLVDVYQIYNGEKWSEWRLPELEKIGYTVLYDNEVKIRKYKGRYRLILPKPKYLI